MDDPSPGGGRTMMWDISSGTKLNVSIQVG